LSSIRLFQNVDIVVFAGKEKVFMSASTSLSIKAPALVTFAVFVTFAQSSTFRAESSPDLVIDQVSHTTACTASV
jgi:hypothetical protein